jgi:hypothetical protein
MGLPDRFLDRWKRFEEDGRGWERKSQYGVFSTQL